MPKAKKIEIEYIDEAPGLKPGAHEVVQSTTSDDKSNEQSYNNLLNQMGLDQNTI